MNMFEHLKEQILDNVDHFYNEKDIFNMYIKKNFNGNGKK